MALSGVAALKLIRWRHLTTPATPQPVGGAPPRKTCQQQPTNNRQWVRIAPPAGPRRVVQSLALFSEDCEQIRSFSSSFFLLQEVSSRGVSLLSWPADVGSLQRLPSSLTQKLRQARVLDSRSFFPTEFVFGEFLSSWDVDRPGQSASASPCIGESRAFEVTLFPVLKLVV